jgi:hypothetical protein
MNDVPIDEPCVISKYIEDPYIINGKKFDIRIYVVVTSFDPLKIYIYEEGLCRFASENYDSDSSSLNKYMHLTNYSVNKKNEKFIQNEDCSNDGTGNKWSIAALNRHFETIGIDSNFVWSKIYDVIIKSIISIDDIIIE